MLLLNPGRREGKGGGVRCFWYVSAMKDLRNFHQLDERLYTSGQPSEAQLGLVREHGVHLIVNLALSSSDRALIDERASVEALGMRYVHIPVAFDAPSEADYAKLEQTLREHGPTPVLVHCAYNYRASSFMALYALKNLGWSHQQATALRTLFWHPDPVWEAWARALTPVH